MSGERAYTLKIGRLQSCNVRLGIICCIALETLRTISLMESGGIRSGETRGYARYVKGSKVKAREGMDVHES